MRKVRTFHLDDYEEANLFLETHSPSGNGLLFQNNYIVIIYDEGEMFHHEERKASLLFSIAALKEEIFKAEQDLAYWKLKSESRKGTDTKLEKEIKEIKENILILKSKKGSTEAKETYDEIKKQEFQLKTMKDSLEWVQSRDASDAASLLMAKGNIEEINLKLKAREDMFKVIFGKK